MVNGFKAERDIKCRKSEVLGEREGKAKFVFPHSPHLGDWGGGQSPPPSPR